MQLEFEVHGSKGSIVFSQEHFNVLRHYKAGGDPKTSGFTTIESGPQHAPYGNFCVAQGHQIGFNDLKTIEMAEFLGAIASGGKASPDFREAWEIQKVVEAALRSSQNRRWFGVS
jgi:predicted dehydrogenase